MCAWGQKGPEGSDDGASGVADLAAKLRADPGPRALAVLPPPLRRVGPAGWRELAAALAENAATARRGGGGPSGHRGLEELLAAGHAIAPAECEALAAAARGHPGLRALEVGDGALGCEGAAALARGLAGGGLRRWTLEGKGLKGPGVEAIAAAISQHDWGLEELLLSDNPIGDEGVAFLSSALGQLRALELRAAQVTAVGAAWLADGLGQAPRLERLALGGNPGALDAAACAALGDALRLHPALQELGLGGCGVGDAGLAALADGLQRAPALRELDLSGNALSAQCGLPLTWLARARHLVRLDLSGNAQLGDPGCHHLVQGLRSSDAQGVALDVAGCGLSAAAVAELAGCANLQGLRLAGNPLGDAGGAAVGAAFRSGGFRGLATLDLCCTGIGLAGAEAAVAPLLPGDAEGEAECGPALCALLLAANPCTREEGWAGRAAEWTAAGAARDLRLVWEAADAGETARN